ncbi:hypothetical protein K438DRAFT_1756006 [Mycena galopus ATCC 62051]|nr:hypothetical protein K438DRAFT_1756006 [Mycena galopus ATCC 62051]
MKRMLSEKMWIPQELVHVRVRVMAVSIPTLSLDSKWARSAQANIDYAISEVFRQLPKEIKEFLLIYDVSCQWVIHWISRFMDGKYLFFPKDVVLTPAVGKFHLGAHILACFWEFSLNFIEGTGQVDGEILETLWASLDKVVGSTRSMSRAHRQEVLDDYMNDSNWKKLVGAVSALIRKMDRATEGLASTEEAFEQLTSRVGADVVAKWENEEKKALAPGGIGRKIYKAETIEAPGVAEICLHLTEMEKKTTGRLSGSIALITEGLKIQDAQNNIIMHAAALGKCATATQKKDLIGKRDHLQKRIEKFHKAMLAFVRKHDTSDNDGHTSSSESSSNSDSDSDDHSVHDLFDSEDEEALWEDEENEDTDEEIHSPFAVLPERIRLSLPSNLKKGCFGDEVLAVLFEQEGKLREGQINEALRKLRMALGEKAWMLRNRVREASGGKSKLRAWSGVKAKNNEVGKQVKRYRQATAALRRMGLGAAWKPITKQDLKMSGDMVEANRTGQRADTLAWFWRLEDGEAGREMNESGAMGKFYRVNWLRAKARVARWREETEIVSKEMNWTISSFLYKRDQWRQRSDSCGTNAGCKAYADKQSHLWGEFATHGAEMFEWAKGTPKEGRWRKRGPGKKFMAAL